MSEKSGSHISRRTFLKWLPVALGGAALASQERSSSEDPCVYTDEAVFRPLYEIHENGPVADEIKPSVDIIFREYFEFNPKERNSFSIVDASEDLAINYLPPVLRQKFEEGLPIAFGDIGMNHMLEKTTPLESFSSVAVGLSLLKTSYDALRKKKAAPQAVSISRRRFMKVLTGVTSFVVARDLLPQATWLSEKFTPPALDSIAHIIQRLQAIVNHTDTSDFRVFYRNVAMASKLLELGHQYTDKEKPEIAFSVGVAHEGIEDFLRAGSEFTNWVLLHVQSPDVLRQLVDDAGSPENFVSLKILQKVDGQRQTRTVKNNELVSQIHAILSQRS